MEIAIHPSTAGLSAIWDNAVAKFKLNTEIDLYDPRAIVQPHSTTLEDVEGPNSLLTAFQHRREHSAKLKYQRALLLVKLMPVLGDVEWLLRTEDRDEEDNNLRRTIVHRSICALLLLADEERICIAINALFDRLPTIPRPDVQLTLTARNALDNILISYIDLMGVSHRLLYVYQEKGRNAIAKHESVSMLLSEMQWKINDLSMAGELLRKNLRACWIAFCKTTQKSSP